MDVVMFVLFALGGILLYLLPTIVAANRRHPSTGPIATINILTGWTFLGWVIALIWSLADTSDVQTAPSPAPKE
jgi:hypothetical protein